MWDVFIYSLIESPLCSLVLLNSLKGTHSKNLSHMIFLRYIFVRIISNEKIVTEIILD